jgi:hypothetical protein
MKPELPSPSAFWILSSAYFDAGDSALATIRTRKYSGFMVMPCVFLFFRSIELALKSVLVFHGVPEHEVARSLGHRISALLSRAEPYTPLEVIGILPADRQLLDRFSDDYSNKLFEYSDDWWSYPHLEELQSLAQRVTRAVQGYKRNLA